MRPRKSAQNTEGQCNSLKGVVEPPVEARHAQDCKLAKLELIGFMAPKHIPPAIGLRAFSCARCGALASQKWCSAYAIGLDEAPRLMTFEDVDEIADELQKLNPSRSAEDVDLDPVERSARGELFLERGDSIGTRDRVQNLHVSLCYSCHELTLWHYDKILYPRTRHEIEPSPDLPSDIQQDFEEARDVLDLSPRAAAALLRLCIQKMCKALGQPGKNINDDIGSLVKQGLNVRVQKALDIVRVVGNNAVHPGTIDLKDDRETAAKLFDLVNLITYELITHPRELDALFANKVPDNAKEQIAKRDGKK